jgi:signal transduction histidine kinase
MEHAPWEVLLFGLVGLLLAGWGWERAGRRRAELAAGEQREAAAASLRLVRLATSEQRTVALTLFGHAQVDDGVDPALTGLARRLMDMSDTLAAQTEAPAAPRRLDEEEFDLGPQVQFALEQVTAHLGPGRRVWRIDAAVAATRLRADRRALNQVLVSVLSGAAAATRDGDWIEVSVQEGDGKVCILVEDEGVGLPLASGGHPAESRGIGLRLTLARSLMQAHGGALLVESAERVGTRVRLAFPRGMVG